MFSANISFSRQAFASSCKLFSSWARTIEGKEEALNALREEINALDEALRNAQEQFHKEQSKLEALTNLTERYEGYGGAVKAVMEQKTHEKRAKTSIFSLFLPLNGAVDRN